jgi:hypothetical protein
MSSCSVLQTSSVPDQEVQEIALVVSSFVGVSAFWAASCAAFSQNVRKLHPTPFIFPWQANFQVTVFKAQPAGSDRIVEG